MRACRLREHPHHDIEGLDVVGHRSVRLTETVGDPRAVVVELRIGHLRRWPHQLGMTADEQRLT
ncbi:MAG: hypothetical protein IH939_15880 [Acidobacteria bacterium]|nr:hypothetical protein [Acidobacteriota bacterium]